MKTLWRHPDRELRAERQPFAVEVMLTFATSALAMPLKHAVRLLGDRTGYPLAPMPKAEPQNL